MFDVQSYLDLPNEPDNCIYENYRDKILINPTILNCLLKQNHKEEMKNIHMLHNSLYDKYGEDWVDKISFIDEALRNAIKSLYIKDYPGKDLIISMQTERKELYKKGLQISELGYREHNDSSIDKNSGKTKKKECHCQISELEESNMSVKSRWNDDDEEELFLTREMVEGICDITFVTYKKAQKGLCFYVCDDFTEISQKAIENGMWTYFYDDNNKILIVENDEEHVTEVYSKKALKVVCGAEDNEGLFEDVLLTRLCLRNLDLTCVESMKQWFVGAKIDVIDFANVNTPNLLNMSGMFFGSEINNIIWGNITTSYVTDMSQMFCGCNVPELLLSSICTTRVQDMSEMFYDCKAKKIDCSNFDTRNVRNMDCMFCQARVEELDLSGFNTTKVRNMDLMFSDCDVKRLNIKNFRMTSVESSAYMFGGCEAKVVAKDKAIISIYKKDTEKEIDDFDYRYFSDILNAKLENLDVDMLIIETIMGSTRCELIKHLWGLSSHELCFQVGLNKNEVEEVLDEMEKIANITETSRMRLMSHIERCRKKLLLKGEM